MNEIKIEHILLKNWNDGEQALIVAENDDWLLTGHFVSDYLIDGYKLYNKKHIEKRTRSEHELLMEKVLKLQGKTLNVPSNFTFSDTLSILKWVENHYGVIEFQDNEEEELFYGKIQTAKKFSFSINYINTEGIIEPDFDYEFDYDEIRIISFGSDYQNAIDLLHKNK